MLPLPLVIEASLQIRTRADGVEFLRALAVLFRSRVRMELDLAMLLAWYKRQDLAEIGYSSFSAFCRENVDWSPSWMRDLIRLVESPLDLVKQAVAEGAIPLVHAIRAPGHVTVAEQAAWLMDSSVPEVATELRVLDEVSGDDAIAIRKARKLARICLGVGVSYREVDDYIVACWRDGVTPTEILDRAFRRPERPVFEPMAWDWQAPSREAGAPGSFAEARERLGRLQATLHGLTRVVSRAWSRVVDERIWADAYDDVASCAFAVLGLSLRQTQRLAKLGRTLERWPAIDRAVKAGLSLGAADRLGAVAQDVTVERWLELARQVGATELACATEESRWEERPTLEMHAEAAKVARATSTGARVAIRRQEPEEEPSPAPLRVIAELVPASRWWVTSVELPKYRGFAAVKVRDQFRCQNPECGRVSLRNEAHHIDFRRDGGIDDPETNGVTVCRACHLRLIHAGRLQIERVVVDGVPVLKWTWADRCVVQVPASIRARAPRWSPMRSAPARVGLVGAVQ